MPAVWYYTVVASALVSLIACAPASKPTQKTKITIVTGGTGGAYYPLGEALARLCTSKIPGVVAASQSTVASVFNVQAIEQEKADIAFTQGDVAYFAYKRGTDAYPNPHTRLRGIAVLYPNTVQIVTKRDSQLYSVRDFRGRRVGVGSPASGTESDARIIIESYGLKYADVGPQFLSFTEVAARIEKGTLDAGFIVASYPVAAVTAINRTIGVRLIPVDREAVNRIRSQFPFFRPIVIPENTYRGQTVAIETVGVDNLLVCRDDLPEEMVYQVTKIFFDALPVLARTSSAAKLIDPDQAPTTPIPLHPGAARYYRERELLR